MLLGKVGRHGVSFWMVKYGEGFHQLHLCFTPFANRSTAAMSAYNGFAA